MRRARARAAMTAILAYDGAKTGRRTEGWSTTGASASAEIGVALHRLRERSRDLERNNVYARKAVSEMTNCIVGTGITPYASTGIDSLDAEVMAAFESWSESCDADGQLDFYGLQQLMIRTMNLSGEVLIRFRQRRPEDGLKIPLQLQVMEPDHLDTDKTEPTVGGTIINGVEFDLLGRRVAYWLFPQHPGDAHLTRDSFRRTQSVKVPASEIVHLYRKERPSQVRGVPMLTPAITKLRDFDDFQEAELVRKKIEACVVAFVSSPDGLDAPPIGARSTDSQSGNRWEEFQPGMVQYGRQGEDVKFFSPSAVGGYGEYVAQNKRDIAAGLEMTYEQLSADLSTVNYSSYRAGQLSFRAGVDSFRWNVFMPMALRPIWRRFIDTAFLAGEISTPAYRVTWSPPAWGSVEPQKDADAIVSQIRSGLMTYEQAVLEYGFDPRRQLSDIERINKMLDEKGIILDCDPRKGPAGKQAQQQQQGAQQEKEMQNA